MTSRRSSREPIGVQIHEATDALLFDGHVRVEVLRPRATTDRAQVQRHVNLYVEPAATD